MELRNQGIKAEAQVPVSVFYKGSNVGEYVVDIIVENTVVLELKTVEELTSVHQAQLLNYLRATNKPLGLLVNFKGKKAMIRRLALGGDSVETASKAEIFPWGESPGEKHPHPSR